MKAIIVDDFRCFRDNLEAYLKTELNFEVIASFENGLDFLNADISHEADIILMDICMPGIDGIETSKRVLWQNHQKKIIAITMYKDKTYLTRLIEAGIKGCVFKDQLYKDLPVAMNTVLNDKLFLKKELLVTL